MDEATIVKVGSGFGTKIEVLRANYRSHSFARHSHDTYTLGLVRAGAGSFWCRGAERDVRAGDIVVIRPGEVHTGSVDRDAGFLSYLAIYLPPEIAALHAHAMENPQGQIPEFRAVVFRDRGVGKAFEALDRATSSSRKNDGDAESAACLAISALMMRRSDAGDPKGLPRPARATVGEPRVVSIVREALEDSFAQGAETSLHALANLTGVTPFHVIRVFRETTGMTPHQYLLQIRVERARGFLANGVNPSLAALESGFVDQSHLTHHFKKRFGITPSSYQKCVAGR